MTDHDAYTGQVTPGGPPDVRQLPRLTITKVAVDPPPPSPTPCSR